MKITPEHVAEMVRDLQAAKAHGDLILQFAAGEITLVRDNLTYKPETIVEAYSGAKRRQVFVVSKRKDSSATLSNEGG